MGNLRNGHKGRQLDACATNSERAKLCRAWAEKARNDYYDGLAEEVNRAARNTSLPGDERARRILGEVNWNNNPRSKSLIGLEQMYWRWMNGYAALVNIGIDE